MTIKKTPDDKRQEPSTTTWPAAPIQLNTQLVRTIHDTGEPDDMNESTVPNETPAHTASMVLPSPMQMPT